MAQLVARRVLTPKVEGSSPSVSAMNTTNKRTIVIGDLHGCYDETIDLLDKLAVSSSDRVIFVGDLIDRGPKPAECVDLAMKHESVMGNHEEKHLRIRWRPEDTLSPSHRVTRNFMSDEHYKYFEKLPLTIELPEYKAVVVHAGLFPIERKQTKYHLLHIQSILPPATETFWPSKAPKGFKFWTNFWKGPKKVIFGHTVFNKPLVSEFAYGIDTGAVFGGNLTALVLPNWEIVSVPSRQNYFKHKKATFHAMEDVFMYS